MRFDQLTLKAQEAVAEAQKNARDRGHAEISPEHLLAALVSQNEGIVPPIQAPGEEAPAQAPVMQPFRTLWL